MLSYKEYENALIYYFQEAFNPKETSFGVNGEHNDGEFEVNNNKTTTYFLSGNTKFKVDLVFDGSCYHVKFSRKRYDELNFTYEMQYDLDSSLSIFNRVMFIVSEFLNIKSVECLAFGHHESNTKLSSLYTKMIKNKSFLRLMSSKGFEFVKTDENINFFKKVK